MTEDYQRLSVEATSTLIETSRTARPLWDRLLRQNCS